MIVEIGHYALVLALVLTLFQATFPLWGAIRRDAALVALGPYAAIAQFLLISVSFAALTYAYLVSDFSVSNVYENSHTLKPLIYKWSGVWGNHEGSMLLWVLILALFGAGVAVFSRNLPNDLLGATLAVQAMIAAAFLAFVLFASNPFLRLGPAPFEGRDLNPILQDPGLAIHPPLLYLGYVGYSIVFSFAAGALIVGRIDAAFARMLRPWNLVAWITLTLGIAMGSYWAYYELGWGGYWFWDPVENASLMPWLTGTALLHSAIVMEKREALKIWTILLAIITFSLSLLGTFLVRSGVLTSVHAFAVDPERGLFILIILVAFIGGSFTLFALRARAMESGGLFAPVSREGALVLNNLFLAVAALAVLVGTLYPLALEGVTGQKISVGPPFFNLTVVPLMLPLFVAIPFGQRLAWKRGDLLGVAQRMVFAMGLSLLATLVVAYHIGRGPALAIIAIGLGIFILLASLDEIRERVMRGGTAGALHRLIGLPRTFLATALAHAGVGIMVIGIAFTAFEKEAIVSMKPGETVKLGEYSLTLRGIAPYSGPNYTSTVAHFVVHDGTRQVAELRPAKRVYIGRQMPTSEVGRHRVGFSEVYVAIGETSDGNHVDLRAYWKPFVTLIWLGPVLMALAGLLSLSDRRLRVGAPRVAARRPERLEPAE
ncbi:MAG: heme lyase CcmF/NrfE family subunit [Methylobacterium sp.]|jgi:cytochrome c-type biogenesis protein CcmF|nr:heme lyase CcmF/NrfE family subunit [Methylobacterium sp.]MCA3645247.1 heme lyase CcmF/NrfE family subunit [Methylobacterium sp.]MCA3652014.1 heme lyase CcmF/NrfE family subunit [Methylobacterium sp.]MCA4921758.1 heme lyase CcmF/NrfE family subunit [Methylobacterium sp.]MCE2932856.1 heme lyase CcmF/NrfE family subunit [Hyphomicrobiales bacterium]